LLSLPIAELLKVQALAVTEKLVRPEKKAGGLVLEGDINEMADKLVALLKEKTSVLR
jgi:electron transfer flavoprotein beta subunit